MPVDDGPPPRGTNPSTTIKFGVPPLTQGEGLPDEGAGGYRLGARLGHSGEVHEAHNPRVDGRVALKLYRRATGASVAALEAFGRDAARATSLRHPHIAHVIETGHLRDGTPFMTMEYLVGQTLEERLADRDTLPAPELVPLVRGVAAALSAAHAAGVTHRELRPDNIFLADVAGYEAGFVKLLDFGACHLTEAQLVAGRALGGRAVRYLAPEQSFAPLDEVDARADQYALAALAYRMLSGADPPRGDPATAGLERGAAGKPALWAVLARRAPVVDAVVSKALSRSPEARFESVALFVRAFEEALASAAVVASPEAARTVILPSSHPALPAGPRLAPATQGREADLSPRPSGRERAEVAGGGGAVGPTSRPRVPVPTAPVDRKPAQARREPSFAPRPERPFEVAPVRVPERGSLTQQFFDEGDHQEATRFKDAPAERDLSTSDLDFDSFDRVPTRKKPLIVAVIAVALGASILAWWFGVRPPRSWWTSGAPHEVAAPGGGQATEASPPPVAMPRPDPARAMLPQPPPAQVEPAQGSAAAGAVDPNHPAPPLPAVPGTTPKAANAATQAVPATSPTPQAEAQAQAAEAVGTAPLLPPARPATRGSHTAGARPTPAASRGLAPRREPALRGYIWSPERREIVPARDPTDLSEPWPPASESPPPPTLEPGAPGASGPPPFTQ